MEEDGKRQKLVEKDEELLHGFMSSQEIVNLIRTKQATCKQIASFYLSRIHKFNDKLNAFVYINENIVEEASALDDLLAQGTVLPLHGLPVSIKVIIPVKGMPHSMMSKNEPTGVLAKEDCTAVKRLRESGCLFLGLTNMPEYGMAYETVNDIAGKTLNPYNDDYSCGGSSGGESAALAAGLSPLGLGTDIAGSVRIPAHFSGICSLKACRGRIPLSNGLAGMRNRLRCYGLMARDLNDIKFALPYIAGPCPNDPESYNIRPLNISPVDVKSLKIAYFKDNGVLSPHPEVARSIDIAVDTLKKLPLQHPLVEDKPDRIDQTHKVWHGICSSTGGAWIPSNPDAIVAEFIKQAKEFQPRGSGDEVAIQISQAVTDVSLYETSWLNFFRKHDVVITPVVSSPATKHLEGTDWKRISYCMAFNVFPAAACVVGPVAFTSEGTPLGVQVISHDETACLSVALYLQDKLNCLSHTPKQYH